MGGRGVFLPSCDDGTYPRVVAEEADVQARLGGMVTDALHDADEETRDRGLEPRDPRTLPHYPGVLRGATGPVSDILRRCPVRSGGRTCPTTPGVATPAAAPRVAPRRGAN